MFDASIPFWKPSGKQLGEMEEGDWAMLDDILVNSGLLKEKVPLNQVINYEILKEAHKGP
jgi:hypothetical protein